jgi:hypothetical protein
MKNVPQLFIVTVVLLFASTAPAMAQHGNQPPMPVTVTNTPANPVPVVGTLNGTVTLTNSPTVKIDSTANTVVVASAHTAMLLNTGAVDIAEGGYPIRGPVNVANYSKVRIIAVNYNNSDGNFSVYPTILVGNLWLPLDDEGWVTLAPGQGFSRVYEVLGDNVQVVVSGNGSNRNGVITVFAK